MRASVAPATLAARHATAAAAGYDARVGILQDLQRARVHVEDGERRVAEQRELVAELARDGHSTDAAVRLLVTLEETLQIMRDHLAVEEQLARERPA
jgi:hypothetical protein